MGPFEIFVVYVIAWWMIFFAALPFGVRGQGEAGDVVRGSERGAPVKPDLKRKAVWTSAIAVVPTAIAWFAISHNLLRFVPSLLGDAPA